jgi:uncharacterized protein (TIGR00645 family)
MAEPRAKSPFEHLLERWVFRSRWLMAPFYLGLVIALGVLLVAFIEELAAELAHVAELNAGRAIVMVLSLIDLSLAGNLLLIVLFSGYENFVSKIDTIRSDDRPEWMGTIDFSGMKMKLIASIVAISTVALLRAFIDLSTRLDDTTVNDRRLAWLLGIHVTLVVTGLLFAVMDFLASRAAKH